MLVGNLVAYWFDTYRSFLRFQNLSSYVLSFVDKSELLPWFSKLRSYIETPGTIIILLHRPEIARNIVVIGTHMISPSPFCYIVANQLWKRLA